MDINIKLKKLCHALNPTTAFKIKGSLSEWVNSEWSINIADVRHNLLSGSRGPPFLKSIYNKQLRIRAAQYATLIQKDQDYRNADQWISQLTLMCLQPPDVIFASLAQVLRCLYDLSDECGCFPVCFARLQRKCRNYDSIKPVILKKSILIIDDDVDILNIVAIILKNRGYEVITDTTGSYIETMQSLPHMIILDIALNGYDGREICKKLKSIELTAGIPVMFLSANLDLHNICEAHKADDYLTKPFEIADLIKKVDKFMVAA